MECNLVIVQLKGEAEDTHDIDHVKQARLWPW